MSKPGKLQTSWQILRTSLQIMRRHPKLLLFPIVTTLCSVVIVVFFFAPALYLPTGHSWTTFEHWKTVASPLLMLSDRRGVMAKDFGTLPPTAAFSTIVYLYGAALYLGAMFCATFFNVAFYHLIMKALGGESISITDGFRFAGRRLRSILYWSLCAGVVGLIIQAIEQRLSYVGRFVTGLIGTAWSVASIFVIPGIVREDDPNPLHLLRNSAATLKKTWGEALVGFVGVRFIGLLLLLPVIGIFLLLILGRAFRVFGTVTGNTVPFGEHGSLLGLWVPVFLVCTAAMLISYFTSLVNHIYRCALYIYASEGVVPELYTPELLDAAWKVKKS